MLLKERKYSPKQKSMNYYFKTLTYPGLSKKSKLLQLIYFPVLPQWRSESTSAHSVESPLEICLRVGPTISNGLDELVDEEMQLPQWWHLAVLIAMMSTTFQLRGN